MSVSTTHPAYEEAQIRWSLTRAASKGVNSSNGAQFIPKRSGEGGDGGEARYQARVDKAIYTNYTGRTKTGLIGAIYRKPPSIVLPSGLDFIESDADGSGQSLQQFSKELIDQVFDAGRVGVLVDYPQVKGTPTIEQIKAQRLRPSLKTYDADSIINWKTKVVGGQVIVNLIVLLEAKPVPEDEFGHGTEPQYRVLRINDDDVYTQQIYDKDENNVGEEVVILDGDSSTFNYIPFHFLGAENNLPSIDEPVLYDIATLNIGHYRNSADWENNLSIHSGGTIVIGTAHSNAEWKEANGEGEILLGEGGGLRVSEGGFAELLQLDSAQAVSEEMVKKETRMQQIGARIISKSSNSNETATAAEIRAASETSILDTVVGNTVEVIKKCIRDCLRFAKVAGEFEFDLNRDYWMDGLDPQLAIAMIQLHDIETLPKESIIKYLQSRDIVDSSLSVDEVVELIRSESPIS